jgi:hypothetical protein
VAAAPRLAGRRDAIWPHSHVAARLLGRFRELIGLVHNILFLGRFTFVYDGNLSTPASPWGRESFSFR